MPTIEEIEEDPVGAYYNMTGEFADAITAEEVKEALAKQVSEKETKKKEKEFRYVYTPLIEAIKNGYLIEIQERATRLRLKRPYTNNYIMAVKVA